MAARLGPLALFLVLLALTPATGRAASSASSKDPSVRLVECDTKAQSATFRSTMRTISGAQQLAMRFTLQSRSEDQTTWTAVRSPGFDAWLTAKRGRTGFRFDKTVAGLPAPGEYRVLVRYRWRDAAGDTLERTRKTSKTCEQPDPRPDLVPTTVDVVGGVLELSVVNGGEGLAPATPASLSVGGRAVDRTVPALAPGATAKVRFDGVTCIPGDKLVATVDPADAVDEADETGNVLTVSCPARGF